MNTRLCPPSFLILFTYVGSVNIASSKYKGFTHGIIYINKKAIT